MRYGGIWSECQEAAFGSNDEKATDTAENTSEAAKGETSQTGQTTKIKWIKLFFLFNQSLLAFTVFVFRIVTDKIWPIFAAAVGKTICSAYFRHQCFLS